MRKFSGLTLLELLITITITALVLMIGVPTMLGMQKATQLKGAVEVSYYVFQQARSLAIIHRNDITLVLNESASWCIALSDKGHCDCHIYLDCSVNGVEHKVDARDFNLINMQGLTFGPMDIATFDGVRGLAIGSAGSAVFSDGSNQVKLILSNMGRLRICTLQGQLGSYESC